MSLIVGATNQLAEQVEIKVAAGLGGLRKLSGKEAVHHISPRSPDRMRRYDIPIGRSPSRHALRAWIRRTHIGPATYVFYLYRPTFLFYRKQSLNAEAVLALASRACELSVS